jgi:hypothetical protein
MVALVNTARVAAHTLWASPVRLLQAVFARWMPISVKQRLAIDLERSQVQGSGMNRPGKPLQLHFQP